MSDKKMTVPVIKAISKENVFNSLKPTFDSLNAEYVGNVTYIPLTFDDTEVWVEVKLTTKNWYDSKSSIGKVIKGFDVFEKQREHEEDMEIKRAEAEADARTKADKQKQKNRKTVKKTNTTGEKGE